MRADTTSATAFDDRVDDGAALAGVGSSDEHPVLLSEGCGADGVFGIVVIYLNLAYFEIELQGRAIRLGHRRWLCLGCFRGGSRDGLC